MATVFLSHRPFEQDEADRLAERLAPAWRVLTHAVSARPSRPGVRRPGG